MRVAVIGGSGFVGRAVMRALPEAGHDIIAISRDPGPGADSGVTHRIVADLTAADAVSRLTEALEGAGAVIDMAAATPATARADETVFARNVLLGSNIAKAAIAAGVAHLIYLSSAQVTGTATHGRPIDEATPAAPADAYARSKLDTEVAVREICQGTRAHWTVVRPPLVYGAGAKGALLQLAKAVDKGVPLPLASVTGNRRDLIGVTNLARFIVHCLGREGARDQVFFVRDGAALSTRSLIEALAAAASKPARLLPVPPPLLAATGRLLGAARNVERLLGDFEVDDSKARRMLDWKPPLPMSHDLTLMMKSLAG